MRTACAVLLIGASLALSSCGSKCDASNCASGCCDSSGQCAAGNTEDHCGANAGSCAVCSKSQQCSAGACIAAVGGGTGGGGTGGGSATGGGSGTGGGSSTGGGSATGGGGSGGGPASSAAGPDGFAVAKTVVMFLAPNARVQVGLFGDNGFCARQQRVDAGTVPVTQKYLSLQLTDSTGLKAQDYPIAMGVSPGAVASERFSLRLADGGIDDFFAAAALSGTVTITSLDQGDGGAGNVQLTGSYTLTMDLGDGGAEPLSGNLQTNCPY